MTSSDDQNELIAFLGSPNTHSVDSVERIDANSAIVFLAGDFVLKLKRAVKCRFWISLPSRNAASVADAK